MSFKALAAAMVTAARNAFGVAATVTPPGAGAIPGVVAIIDKGAEVLDEFGVVVDSRIEVEVFRSEVGNVTRGTIVTEDETGESFRLLEPISTAGDALRWIASEA